MFCQKKSFPTLYCRQVKSMKMEELSSGIKDSASGLHAVLYNIKSQNEWHTHNEVNGLSLSGLGNRPVGKRRKI